MWWALRRHGHGSRFRRQHPIGPYFGDFVCLETKLIIEVDGFQHGSLASDRVRDDWLRRQGFRVLRFWNSDVFYHLEEVLDVIGDVQAELRQAGGVGGWAGNPPTSSAPPR